MDPQKITELANLLRDSGDKILNSEFTLTLSGALLRALNDSFTLIADNSEIVKPYASSSTNAADSFQVVKPIASKSPVFRDLQLVHDFVQKTALLCVVHYAADEYFEGRIDIGKFRALRRLEVQKTNVRQIVGIQRLRAQLQQLICVRSLHGGVEDIITRCGGDNSNGFVWNELKAWQPKFLCNGSRSICFSLFSISVQFESIKWNESCEDVADFSYNNLKTVDSSLEFAQFLQHLNLRNNQLHSVEAIKWLPHLKTLDLSYNKLPCIPQFHTEACKRLQSLNIGYNFVEDLMGLARLEALTDLDLCDNCLLDHTSLLPLSALLTLRFLNLHGNPLHCHPKHRLATAQFLHKNTASVKFILDFETLSKSERALTGSQQLRHVGSLNRYYASKSSAASISGSSSVGRLTPAASTSQTPASSVGSLRSFKFQESDAAASSVVVEPGTSTRKRVSKIRTVDFEEDEEETVANATTEKTSAGEVTDFSQETSVVAMQAAVSTDHLETKRHIQSLREKYGADWLLQSGNAEIMHSVLGIESSSNQKFIDQERNASRQLFNDFLGEFSDSAISQTDIEKNDQTLNSTVRTSTPTDSTLTHDTSQIEGAVTPIKSKSDNTADNNNSLYMSIVNTTGSTTAASDAATNPSLYQSADEGVVSDESKSDEPSEHYEDDDEHLKHIYSTTTTDEEPEISETEDDEVTYIVYSENHSEAIFLTISANFLRERDTITQRTKTKWSLKILESCDRFKSNTIRINFDTVKVDKQERVYTVEDDVCQELQELEHKLRDILSQRDFSEMNQTIYRCVNCNCQFSHENKHKPQQIRCPDCKSTFIAEIHDIPKSLEKFKNPVAEMKLSPAAIVEESPVSTPLVVGPVPTSSAREVDNNSIGSANSLNESSSCSKITNSQNSFDSNRSVVGSSNTDRDNDFKSNCESDVEIISNPSQSSIEVLDHSSHQSSRKTSEERRISHIPNLETIDDHSYKQNSFIEREFAAFANRNNSSQMRESIATPALPTVVDVSKQSPTKVTAKPSSAALPHFNLTESSSSGSVTDSVCTAYEQQAAADKEKTLLPDQKNVIHNLLATESGAQVYSNNNNNNNNNSPKGKEAIGTVKKEDSGISSMFGALFQSTNMLMSSSKKLIDAEAASQDGSATTPYKFNYTDFKDVDHRLKLYFYQTKFEEEGEHFKWLARGRIFNEMTRSLCDGLVVMSTCKCYLMEAYAPEHDDVTKWLRHVVSVTVDRLESIQLLPWKMGLAFDLRDWGGFLLLLQDILRTDSLLLYFANNSLPSQCELKYQTSELITKRLSAAVVDEKLEMCSLLNACEISCENAKRNFATCGLLATNNRLYLTSGQLGWLSLRAPQPNTAAAHDDEIQICVTQFMSNLVEVERPADNVFAINFLDETQDKCELWKCTFETKENADSCLNAIGQSWEQLFGVPLFNT